jgi:hypothetical protein
MKRLIIGSVVGVVATLFVQDLYKKHGNFYTFINGVRQDMDAEKKAVERKLNVFDKISLICRRVKLIIN